MTRRDRLVIWVLPIATYTLMMALIFITTISLVITVPITLIAMFISRNYSRRLKKTETFETPVDIAQQPDRLSVVPASESPQKSETRPMLKIKILLRGRPIGFHTFRFDKDVITVGRDPKSDIQIHGVDVAQEHFRFELGPSGYYTLVDLGSGKGTFLNDEQVTRGYVYNNDVVRIGQYTLSIGFEAARYNVG